MSFFSSLSSSQKTASLGANISLENKSLSKEIVDIGDKVVSANKKYLSEIEKYKKLVDFNKKLSGSYIGNLKVMVDVSKLLNDYATLFEILKNELSKTEQQLGTLTGKDVEHLAELTRAKLDQFNILFTDQSKKVKELYVKYDQQEERARVEAAEQSLQVIMDNATETLRTVDDPSRSKMGGALTAKKALKNIKMPIKRYLKRK
jgi:hypothetical protein